MAEHGPDAPLLTLHSPERSRRVAVNALLLGTLLYRSRLVPRAIPLMGLIGASLLLGSAIAVLFGAYDQVSSVSAIATIPIAAWEFSLGIWLVVKGFRPAVVSPAPSSVP